MDSQLAEQLKKKIEEVTEENTEIEIDLLPPSLPSITLPSSSYSFLIQQSISFTIDMNGVLNCPLLLFLKDSFSIVLLVLSLELSLPFLSLLTISLPFLIQTLSSVLSQLKSFHLSSLILKPISSLVKDFHSLSLPISPKSQLSPLSQDHFLLVYLSIHQLESSLDLLLNYSLLNQSQSKQ